MTSSPTTKITARNIQAGMTIQVAGIDSLGWAECGAFRKSSPIFTVTAVTALDQSLANCNKVEVSTVEGVTFIISTRQKVAVVA